jgi:hypothetical protein
MLFLFLTSIGALTIAKQRTQLDYDQLGLPTLLELERRLDAENECLDRELASLLIHHRRLAAGSVTIDTSMLVDSELYESFAALEEEEDNGEK